MLIIAENSDQEALIAQADIDRFYIKVIQPALAEFVPADDVVGLETPDIDEFFEAARKNTHNALCFEMRRIFALAIGAMFERQLRSWLSGKMPAATKKIELDRWPALVKLLETALGDPSGMDLTDIRSLWLVTNSVRHGNGPAVTKLLDAAPQFWDYARKNNLRWKSDLVGNMRISDSQLAQYVKAVMKIWYLAGASQA